MLTSLAPDLWTEDGRIGSFFGVDYPTRMAVVRLSDGGLWVWSPVELTPALQDQVRELGPVRHLVSPDRLHHLFLSEWQAAFLAPPFIRTAIHPKSYLAPVVGRGSVYRTTRASISITGGVVAVPAHLVDTGRDRRKTKQII